MPHRDSPTPREHLCNTDMHLNRIDALLWLATETICTNLAGLTTHVWHIHPDHCDGQTPFNGMSHCLPNISVGDFQERMEGGSHGGSPAAVWSELGICAKGEAKLVEMPNIPFIIVDNAGIPIVCHLPTFYDKSLKVSNCHFHPMNLFHLSTIQGGVHRTTPEVWFCCQVTAKSRC